MRLVKRRCLRNLQIFASILIMILLVMYSELFKSSSNKPSEHFQDDDYSEPNLVNPTGSFQKSAVRNQQSQKLKKTPLPNLENLTKEFQEILDKQPELSVVNFSRPPFCEKPVAKFMFTKNYKVASSTLSSIFTQIATHYHLYEIVRPGEIGSKKRAARNNPGYFMEHLSTDNVNKIEALLPSDEFFWVSSVREPISHLYSYIKFNGWQKDFTHANFNKTWNDYINGKLKKMEGAFENSMCNPIFRRACRYKNDTPIMECMQNVLKKYKVIIPTDRFDEAMVVLHKLTCLPLSDFAYIKNKVNEHPFEMAPEDLNQIMERKNCNKWFYETASQNFDNQFREIGQKYCTTDNCAEEVAQFREENEKLAKSCGLINGKSDKHVKFSFNATKLRNDYKLALRCISYTFDLPGSEFDNYNKILRDTPKEEVEQKLAEVWLKRAGGSYFR